MAKIDTRRSLLVENKAPTMSLNVAPGELILSIDAEQVVHSAHLAPGEAIQLGVALIQLATQAQAMAEAQRLQVVERLPPLTRANGSAIKT